MVSVRIDRSLPHLYSLLLLNTMSIQGLLAFMTNCTAIIDHVLLVVQILYALSNILYTIILSRTLWALIA